MSKSESAEGQYLQFLATAGAVTHHCRGPGGSHSIYVSGEKLRSPCQSIRTGVYLCGILAERFVGMCDTRAKRALVIAHEEDLILAILVAHAVVQRYPGKEVFLFCFGRDTELALNRQFPFSLSPYTEKDVFVVSNVIHDGGRVDSFIGAVEESGGNVIAVGALCNYGVRLCRVGAPAIMALINLPRDGWGDEKICPVCSGKLILLPPVMDAPAGRGE